jgi:hypothetical protein
MFFELTECFSKTSLVLPLPIYFYAISLQIEFLPAALKLWNSPMKAKFKKWPAALKLTKAVLQFSHAVKIFK